MNSCYYYTSISLFSTRGRSLKDTGPGFERPVGHLDSGQAPHSLTRWSSLAGPAKEGLNNYYASLALTIFHKGLKYFTS